mmetsp:Transcript_24994/g.36037  ORF Transcript_24994/g.36037 Transcript_24994/m.36037 type:complete len:125 (-) Transcript_24994:663-1037(-)
MKIRTIILQGQCHPLRVARFIQATVSLSLMLSDVHGNQKSRSHLLIEKTCSSTDYLLITYTIVISSTDFLEVDTFSISHDRIKEKCWKYLTWVVIFQNGSICQWNNSEAIQSLAGSTPFKIGNP